MWTQLECHIGLITSCFPAVNQVFHRFLVGDNSSIESNSVRILRRVVPGMYSIDELVERGLKSGTAEVISMEVDLEVVRVTSEDLTIPGVSEGVGGRIWRAPGLGLIEDGDGRKDWV